MPPEVIWWTVMVLLVVLVVGAALGVGLGIGEQRGREDERANIVRFLKRVAAARRLGDRGPYPRRLVVAYGVGLSPLHLDAIAAALEDEDDRFWRVQDGEDVDARPSHPTTLRTGGRAGGAAA